MRRFVQLLITELETVQRDHLKEFSLKNKDTENKGELKENSVLEIYEKEEKSVTKKSCLKTIIFRGKFQRSLWGNF